MVVVENDNDKTTSNLLLTAIGIIAVGIFCIFVEFSNNKAGNGLFISCIIVVCGLSLYSIAILMSTYKLQTSNNLSQSKTIKILLIINSIINIAALVYFIVIFSKKASDIMKLEILNYIKPYLKAFINTIVIIIIVNIFIYHYLTIAPTQPSDYIPLIIVLAFFGLAECIIEIVFLNIIDKVLKNITDG